VRGKVAGLVPQGRVPMDGSCSASNMLMHPWGSAVGSNMSICLSLAVAPRVQLPLGTPSHRTVSALTVL
jgi:hypothetical protein